MPIVLYCLAKEPNTKMLFFVNEYFKTAFLKYHQVQTTYFDFHSEGHICQIYGIYVNIST